MTWTRILTPIVGGDHDAAMLRTAASLAAPFGATLTGVYTAATPASLFPWAGDGTAIGMEMAIGVLQQAATDGETRAREQLAAFDYPRKEFEASYGEDWVGLRVSARLADVVVFNRLPTHSGSFLSEAFQQILMDERRPVLISEAPLDLAGPVAIAWDGGREASRAARRAVPWLQKAKEVIVVTAPAATPGEFQPSRLVDYLADQGVMARHVNLSPKGEVGPLLLEAVQKLGTKLLVAGAFGHPRFQRFIFGGTTQTLLDHQSGPALFLSH
jgi:nucleotide-binding universal stress UspA family protein